MDIEAIPTPRRHSGTRRYGVTDKHLRRDNARHAGTRKDRSGKRAWDLDGKRRLRSQPQPSNDVDYEQDLDIQHREVVDKKHPGINSWWVEKVLDAIRCRILQYQPLNRQDVELLERLRLSTTDVLKYGLADWEVELLLAKNDPEEPAVNRERNPFRAARRRVMGIPTVPRVPFGCTPRDGKMDLDDYRALARNNGYRNGRVRLIG